MAEKKKRPFLISFICILGFIAFILLFVLLFLDKSYHILKFPTETWLQVFSGVTIILNLFCFAGLWKMKKWAAITLASWFVVANTVNLITGTWVLSTFVICALLDCIPLLYIKRMD